MVDEFSAAGGGVVWWMVVEESFVFWARRTLGTGTLEGLVEEGFAGEEESSSVSSSQAISSVEVVDAVVLRFGGLGLLDI